MPSILKSLLRSTLSKKKDRHPQPLSPGAFSADGDRSPTYSTDELTQLTADLAKKLAVHESSETAPSGSNSETKTKAKPRSGKSRGAFQDKLHNAVQGIEAQGMGQIDPYYPSYNVFPSLLPSSSAQASSSGSSNPANQVHIPPAQSSYSYHPSPQLSHFVKPQSHPSPQLAPTTSYVPPPPASPIPSAGDEWRLAFQSCSAALASAEHLAAEKGLSTRQRQLVGSCVILLDAQRDQLLAMRPWAEDKQLPMFRTLTQVYTEMIHAFDRSNQTPQNGASGLRTVVQVLQEGPDYLIDIGLVECTIWQAEVIDPNYGADIRNLLDEAVGAQVNLTDFRQRLDVLVGVALASPAGALDDDLGKDALDAIQRLVSQLKNRIGAPLPTQMSHAPTPSSPAASSSSASTTPASSPGASPTHTKHTAQTIQQTYGTGPVSTPTASPYPSRLPSPTPSSTSTSSSQKSIFEYRGHCLTRSALELVQTQERLARADSSGQYAGEVSWDDLRNCWIPNWAEKLKVSDLAEGELADTNPANYQERKVDVWGNRIGWYEGKMYYEEEPVFDLRS